MLKKTVINGIVLLGLLILSFLSWLQYHRFSPKQVSSILIENKSDKTLNIGDSLGILLWNLSYGGMPAEMDFFYSGGNRIKLNEKKSIENFQNILDEMEKYQDSTDIFLLHKVDTSSSRSYQKNQFQEIQNIFPDREVSLCMNYSVPYIPVPLNDPIGTVHSGMMNISNYASFQQLRISLNDKEYSWPKKLFTTQKCISMASYSIGERALYILNVHLNSYDNQGEIRLAQLAQIEKLADSLYKKGNLVVIAGGWNMSPPGFKKYRISYGYKAKPAFPEIDSSVYFKNWKFEYNPTLPTSRNLTEYYRHGAINTNIKDFFICSPNVTVLMVHTVNQQFEYSDHHPIYLRILILPKWE